MQSVTCDVTFLAADRFSDTRIECQTYQLDIKTTISKNIKVLRRQICKFGVNIALKVLITEKRSSFSV